MFNWCIACTYIRRAVRAPLTKSLPRSRSATADGGHRSQGTLTWSIFLRWWWLWSCVWEYAWQNHPLNTLLFKYDDVYTLVTTIRVKTKGPPPTHVEANRWYIPKTRKVSDMHICFTCQGGKWTHPDKHRNFSIYVCVIFCLFVLHVFICVMMRGKKKKSDVRC